MSGELLGEWRTPHLLSINETKEGALILASPDGGSLCEIWLFPDGRYSAVFSWGWLRRRYKGEKTSMPKFVDGCEFHRSCFECSESDCRK